MTRSLHLVRFFWFSWICREIITCNLISLIGYVDWEDIGNKYDKEKLNFFEEGSGRMFFCLKEKEKLRNINHE